MRLGGAARISLWALLTAIFLIALVAIVWVFVLTRPEPLAVEKLSRWPWPVACSTRGCVTTRGWHVQHMAAVKFAEWSEQATPTSIDTLTTLIRQHLVNEAQVRSPVTLEDAHRYRIDVLQLDDEVTVQTATGLSAVEYDRLVLLPLLQQESLRQQMKVESLDELFVQLASQRVIWVPLIDAWWASDTARVAEPR